MSTSSVTAGKYNITVQRGADFEMYLRAKMADGSYIDWRTVTPKLDVVNGLGTIVTSYSLTNGMSIYGSDFSYLILTKNANEKNLPGGTYYYDLKVEYSETKAEYPIRGNYTSVNFITK